MTSIPHARLVLDDVKLVRQKLEDEIDEREWRLGWILAVLLLRTVGDVLDKVDGANDPQVKVVAHALYRSWAEGEENAVFREFIKPERDSIVHEYRTAMSEGPIPLLVLSGALMALPNDTSWMDQNIYRPMDGGPFAGEDGRDVIDRAISWWERQLDIIDAAALSM